MLLVAFSRVISLRFGFHHVYLIFVDFLHPLVYLELNGGNTKGKKERRSRMLKVRLIETEMHNIAFWLRCTDFPLYFFFLPASYEIERDMTI